MPNTMIKTRGIFHIPGAANGIRAVRIELTPMAIYTVACLRQQMGTYTVTYLPIRSAQKLGDDMTKHTPGPWTVHPSNPNHV